MIWLYMQLTFVNNKYVPNLYGNLYYVDKCRNKINPKIKQTIIELLLSREFQESNEPVNCEKKRRFKGLYIYIKV